MSGKNGWKKMSKKEFYALGGLSCDGLFRTANKNGWSYWMDCKVFSGRERSGTEHDHNDGVVITEQRAAAKITELIRDVNDGDCALSAIFDDGSTRKLFNFYIDELAFFDADLLGKTETEAHQLHSARIIAYIQS